MLNIEAIKSEIRQSFGKDVGIQPLTRAEGTPTTSILRKLKEWRTIPMSSVRRMV